MAGPTAGLLLRLGSYTPRERRNAREDFCTEVLGFLLEFDPGSRTAFQTLFGLPQEHRRFRVFTQVAYDLGPGHRDDERRGRFDLVFAESEGNPLLQDIRFILENKVDDPAADEQLDRYRQAAGGALIGALSKREDSRPSDGTWIGGHTWAELALALESVRPGEPMAEFVRGDFLA